MIVTIANNKGGTGKSTLAVHLATWLALRSKRVVLIDLDTQGSVARFLGIELADDLAELLRAVLYFRPDRRPPIGSFLTPVAGYGNLVIIRGWGRSAQLEVELHQPGVGPPAKVLQAALAPLLDIPRLHAVIDTGPYAGTLQEAALALADHVVVPGIPEAATESGVLDIARRLRQVGRAITGVVPTKVIANAGEHRRTIMDWRDTLGSVVYYNPREQLYGLPRRVIWGELVRQGRPIWDLAPRHRAAREMETVLRRIAYDTAIQ
jgi:cellulose biosynthesis protein BcsQ